MHAPPSGAKTGTHEFLDGPQGRIQRLGLAATGLGKIRAAAAAAPDLCGHRARKLAGLDARRSGPR